VEIGRLKPSRFQPRRDFSESSLADLASSIKEQGIVQPIVVVARGEYFEIVAGERRWRAASLAGLERVPVTVREKSSDRDMLEAALVENLQREDLNPLEAAEAYARLREEFGLTQEKIADRVGKDRATIANSLRLLKLPLTVRDKIRAGSLSAGHAKALAALPSADDQERLAEEILRRALSVRQTEKRVARMAAGDKIQHEKRRDPFTRDAEEKLSRRLQTRVRILRRRRGGKIEIAFGSEEELVGLYERLSGRSS
jgi:ParB family chromosome partitioning protein